MKEIMYFCKVDIAKHKNKSYNIKQNGFITANRSSRKS